MQDKEITALIKKYQSGNCTANESAFLEDWYMQWNRDMSLPLSAEDLEEDLQIISHNIPLIPKAVPSRQLWLRVAAAAILLITLGIGSYYYMHTAPTEQVAQQSIKNDIPPGKQTATLTLGNGQRIILSGAAKGQIARQAGVAVTKYANGQLTYILGDKNAVNDHQMNTLETARGETYKVILPDGTQVWLNASSSLIYPARFAGADRKVALSGEGYFEVAKDRNHPFKVTTDNQEVMVIGTHFNVNGYANEPAVITTLLEGSVKLTAGENTKFIHPGQQAALRTGHFKVQEIDAEQAVAWKENNFDFEGEELPYIMRMIERWYNVEVIYDGYTSNEKFFGGVSRFANVSEVLKTLEATKKVRFQIQGRKIFVRR